ncbi:MAG TPA: PP2C family protein-serine/threonine phosphatase [Ilumatobacteraceae bacterium]
MIAVVGLALFGALSVGSRVLFNQAEDRLLQQRTNEAASTLSVSVARIQATLDGAANVAAETDGDQAAFAKAISPIVGTKQGQLVTAAAVYRVGSTTPTAHVGDPIALSADGATNVEQQATKKALVVTDMMRLTPRRLGYAVGDDGAKSKYVVYAERALAADPNVRRRTEEPFAQLDYAIYLGTRPVADHLISASVRDLPLHGRTSSKSIEFGSQEIMLVMTPIGTLSGDLFANLWWIVAIAGVVLVLAFAVLARRLLERRDTALALAADNERLYDEQREIAETLQLGLLPQYLDSPAGVSVAARYWPAGAANLIGGDFYDMFAIADDRWAIAIGDVCGKGVEAAALTGLARHTLRAAARNASSPTVVLEAVHQALAEHRPATFCTACFAFMTPLEDGRYRIELSLGGHPQPILRHRDGRVEPVGAPGMLLGMIVPKLSTTVVEVVPGDTLVLYTDGLTDAPAPKAVSVEELAELLRDHGEAPIEELADSIRALKRGRRPQGSDDDTALLIVRFDAVRDVPATQPSTATSEPATSGGSR